MKSPATSSVQVLAERGNPYWLEDDKHGSREELKKFSWKSLNGDEKWNWLLIGNTDIESEAIISNSLKSSDHWTLSRNLDLNARIEREKGNKWKHLNIIAAKRTGEFSFYIQNKFSIVSDETDRDWEEARDQLTKIAMEAANEVGVKHKGAVVAN